MSYIPIVPAVIPRNKEELLELADRLLFSREFHLDLVDGEFVPTVSWPFRPVGDPLEVKTALDRYSLEVDLMVTDPIAVAKNWLKAGADALVFHVETIGEEAFRNFADNTEEASVGVSAHGDTKLETLLAYAEAADYVQLMGIREIGAQGQPFDEAVLDKIKSVKDRFPEMEVTVDGSVNKDTIKRLAEAGADRFICGSAIVKQPDPEAAYRQLLSLINV